MLRSLLCVKEKELRSSFITSSDSSHLATLASQCSLGVGRARGLASNSDSCGTESDADGSSVSSLPLTRCVSTDIPSDTMTPNQQHCVGAGQKNSLKATNITIHLQDVTVIHLMWVFYLMAKLFCFPCN